jgi:hypothetical protein
MKKKATEKFEYITGMNVKSCGMFINKNKSYFSKEMD